MEFKSAEIAENMIAYAIVDDKSSLISLLNRNGIDVPNDLSDANLTLAILTASSRSQNFKDELAKLLTKKVKKAGDEFSSFVGDSTDFGFTGIDDFSMTGNGFVNQIGPTPAFLSTAVKSAPQPPKKVQKQTSRITATNPQGKSAVGLFFQRLGSSLTSEDSINAALNVGLTAINNKVGGRQNALQQEATLITQKQDEVRQSLAKAPAGSKTLTYVFVGVGVLALAAIVYFVTKKK